MADLPAFWGDGINISPGDQIPLLFLVPGDF